MIKVGHVIAFNGSSIDKRKAVDSCDSTVISVESLATEDVRKGILEYIEKNYTGQEKLNILESFEVEVEKETLTTTISFCFRKGFLKSGENGGRCMTKSHSADLHTERTVEASECFPQCLFRKDTRELLPIFVEKSKTKSSPSYSENNDALLLVGVGGIGCEILKLLVLEGFKNIHIIDLDTIDATNLNRQFLFTAESVGHPKAIVSRESVLGWFDKKSNAPFIKAYHDNIKSESFGDSFFSQFKVVLNALDNVSARQHVNFMCMKNDVPLIESGTMGYNGQVQPIVKNMSECYQCQPKPADKPSFAVCTIHARPTTMVHCVHYGKELYEALFGENADENKASELGFLQSILSKFGKDKKWRLDLNSRARFAKELIIVLFHDKIQELLNMKAVWPTQPPTPLGVTEINRALEAGDLPAKEEVDCILREHITTCMSVDTNLRLCAASVASLLGRDPQPFRKEDDSSVLFVSTVSNLRAHQFHLCNQPFEEIRSIAGAIVPAVATTNAMVAAGVVRELLRLLNNNANNMELNTIYVRKAPQTRKAKRGANFLFSTASSALFNNKERLLIHTAPSSQPNPRCLVCQSNVPTVCVKLPPPEHDITLGDFAHRYVVDALNLEYPSISVSSRIVYEEEDYEALAEERLNAFLKESGSNPEASIPFLVLHVDAMDHEVPWDVKVEFVAGELMSQITGVDKAHATEAKLLALKAETLSSKPEERKEGNNIVKSPQDKVGTSHADPIDIDIEAKSDDVIEID